MARLRNVNSGVVVSVDDELVDALGSDWESADEKKATTKRTAKAPAKASDDES